MKEPPSEYVARLEQELERLLAGRFTATEIHNFCHNLHGTVPLAEFAAGCRAEQHRLYGAADDDSARLDFLEQQPAEVVHVCFGVVLPPEITTLRAAIDYVKQVESSRVC